MNSQNPSQENNNKSFMLNPIDGLSLYSLVEISPPLNKKGVLFDFQTTEGPHCKIQLYTTQDLDLGIYIEDNHKKTFSKEQKFKVFFNKPILIGLEFLKIDDSNACISISINNKDFLKEKFKAHFGGKSVLIASIGASIEKREHGKFLLGEMALYGTIQKTDEKNALWRYFSNKWLTPKEGESFNG